MQSTFKNNVASIRRWLAVFMALLFISGFTAIPLEWELRILSRFFETGTAIGNWFEKIYLAIRVTSDKYPFLFYGFDWLAFAHFILAILLSVLIMTPYGINGLYNLGSGPVYWLFPLPWLLVITGAFHFFGDLQIVLLDFLD